MLGKKRPISGRVFLTAERGRAPVDRNALMAAAPCVRRHAGAETLAVAATAAGACVSEAVCVEPGDIHLRTHNRSQAEKRDFSIFMSTIWNIF